MRRYPILISFLLFILYCPRSEAKFNYTYLKDIVHSDFYQSLNLHSSEWLDSIIMLPNDDFDQLAAKQMIQRIDQLPQELLQKISAQRIVVVLFNGKLTDFPSTNHLSGLIPRGYRNTGTTWDDVPGSGGNRIVHVKIGASDYGKGHSSVNLELHELAHSIDKLIFNKIRENAYFLSIWRLEARTLFENRAYFLKFPEEFFAESFAYYYLNEHTRKILYEKAPKTYHFIKNLR